MAAHSTQAQLLQRIEALEQELKGYRPDRTGTPDQADSRIRKAAEPFWRGNEQRYREIVDTMGEAIWLFDWIRQGVVYVNPAYEAIWGRPAKALYGHYEGWLESIHPDDVAFAKESFARIVETGGGEKREYRIVRPDGSVRWVSDRGYAIRDQQGHIVRLAGIAEDITEAKNLQGQLLQSQKMEAIGTLAGGTAHDFNNLLMGIQGRTSIMLVDIDADHPHFENLKGIEEHVRSASNLTRQLLGFAREGQVEAKPLDLGAVIREKNRMFGRMQKGIGIQEKLQPDLWTVEADRSQIEQVLLNVYTNAWQAMPGSGALYVQAANVHLDSRAVAAYRLSAGRYVKISVTDTGIGMDATTCSRIFEPFFTTKEMGRGTGLGLASAYGIVQSHRGFIAVESVEGKGTTVDIYLPATDKRAAADARTIEPLHQGNGTILLVDDEEIIVAVGSQMLRRLGYDVLTATGGREALQICKRHHARISLIILDFIMPDLGGGETCTLLKAVNPAIKVLLSSGYSLNGNSDDIIKYGGDGFIQKPFDLNTLSQKICDILRAREKTSW